LSTKPLRSNLPQQRLLSLLPYALIFGGFLLVSLILLTRLELKRTDFFVYFAGAERLRAGLSLYQEGTTVTPIDNQYLYPPPIAIFCLIFPTLVAGWWGWNLISVLALGLAMVIVVRELNLKDVITTPFWRYVSFIAILLFPPLINHLTWGQLQLILLALLTGAWYCLRHNRDTWAGVLLGVSIALKLYPAICLLPLIVQRRWWAAGVACLSSFSIMALSFWLVGWDQLGIFINQVLPAVNQELSKILYIDYFSMRMTAYLFIYNETGAYSIDLVYRIAIGIAFALVVLRTPRQRDGFIPLAITTMIMLSPIIWSHYFVLLYLPFIHVLVNADQRRRRQLVGIFLFIGISPMIQSLSGVVMVIVHTLPALGLLWLFILQSRLALQPKALQA